jgi:hypothetical protein
MEVGRGGRSTRTPWESRRKSPNGGRGLYWPFAEFWPGIGRPAVVLHAVVKRTIDLYLAFLAAPRIEIPQWTGIALTGDRRSAIGDDPDHEMLTASQYDVRL